VLVASLLLLGSDKPSKTPDIDKEKKSTCCKKPDVQSCPIKSKKTAPDEVILGNLSNQFIFISTFY